MLPTLESGQFVLYTSGADFCVGDVVVAQHPSRPIEIVKRVAVVEPIGLVDLRSDNEADGTDSRTFGLIEVDAVLGVVTATLEWPIRRVERR